MKEQNWYEKKKKFVDLLEQEQPWTHMAQVYEQAVSHCDRKILQSRGMYRRVLLMVILVNALVLASILLQGCGTLTGFQSDVHQITKPTILQRGQ